MKIGSRRLLKPVAGLALFVVAASAVLASCTIASAPPGRTLPQHIRRIYIPEFKNKSRVYGVQADLTLAVNDQFMLDGRLDVVQNERADARLEGTVMEFHSWPVGSSGDEFPFATHMQMVCKVELWDPYDTDRIVPIRRHTVVAQTQFVSDPRRTIAETDVDARERLYEQMARNIVFSVIAGAPDPPDKLEQAGVKDYQRRHSPAKYEPRITEPRFPQPTPYGATPTPDR